MVSRIIVALVLCASLTASAQQTAIHYDIYQDYKRGVELYQTEMYAAAQKHFDMTVNQSKDLLDDQMHTYYINASFYQAACAMELDNPGGAEAMIEFMEKNGDNPKYTVGAYYLGKHYYSKRQYDKAIEWYKEADQTSLSGRQREEMQFQLAYSYFVKKKLNEAKGIFAKMKDRQNSDYYYPANYYYGFIALTQGKYPLALKSFQKVSEERRYKDLVPYYITYIYYHEGQYDELIEYAEPMIEDPNLDNYTEMNQLLGQAYFRKEKYDKALPYLSYYISKARKVSKEDYYQLAFSQYQTGDYYNALENFKELNFFKDSIGQSAVYLMGDCHLKTGSKQEARNAFMEASSMDYDPIIKQHATFNYGKLSYELKFHQIAVSSMQDYIKNYPSADNNSEAQEILADALMNTNDYEKAFKVISEIQNKSSKLKKAYQKVAYFLGVQLYGRNDFDEAKRHFELSLDYPQDGGIQALCNFWLGEVAYKKKEFQEAITYHSKFLDLARYGKNLPENVSKGTANYTIGYSYLKQEKYSSALTYFERTRKALPPGQSNKQLNQVAVDAMMRSGDCAFMMKNYKTALAIYGKAIKGDYPSQDYAYFQQGMIHGLQSNYSKKINTLNDLIKDYPNSKYVDDALFEIGNTHFVERDNPSAIATFERLLRDEKNSPYVREAMMKLGLIYYNQNNDSKAMDYYTQVIDDYPGSAEAKEALLAIRDISPEAYLDRVTDASDRERDSLNYVIAEGFYRDEDCDKAIIAFDQYLDDFPKGQRVLEGYFFKGECLFKNDRFDEALGDYEFVIEAPRSVYSETALLKAARITYFKQEDFAKAINFYEQLLEITEYKDNTFEAIKGLLRSTYQLKRYNDVLRYAKDMLKEPQANQDDIITANYYSAKAWMDKRNTDSAFHYFDKTAQLTTNERGVEARFQMAKIIFDEGDNDESMERAREVINDMPAYEEWVIKSYILIADIMVAKDKLMQAKASLKSIIDNYKGDPALLQLAQDKYDEVVAMEKRGSKIRMDGDNDEFEMQDGE